MGDARGKMLDIAISLATQAAAGVELSPAERALSNIAWIDTQVAPNGFDGWLSHTSCERMIATMKALGEVGCNRVLTLVEQALTVARIDPSSMKDPEREDQVDSLSDRDRDLLFALDSQFYDAADECMERCMEFADRNGAGI
jgi:hypothetical protein